MKLLGFKKTVVFALIAVASVSMLQISSAQNRRKGWRCPGNVYTNDQNLVRQLGGCEELNVNLTIMGPNGQRPRSTPSSPRSSGATFTPQTGLESDARKLIEAELSKKQSELAMLQGQYNNGQPERLMSEANDDSAYQARVFSLSQQIERKIAEIAAIQNELATR